MKNSFRAAKALISTLVASTLALSPAIADAQFTNGPYSSTVPGATESQDNMQAAPTDLQTYCSPASGASDPRCAQYNQTSPYGNRQGEINISPGQTTGRTIPQNNQQLRTLTDLLPPPPPTEFQRVVAESVGKMLPIYGENIFRFAPSTFAPVDNIPVTPDYVIGPGDEVRLQVWGQVNQRGTFIVDRTGSISVPQVGTIHVAGLRYSQLTDFIRSQLGRVYRNFDLNVNLGQLRSIQVFVVGQARQPGSYTIGSLSTLVNALFAAGGPLPQGSLRDIQVKRDGQTVTHFDLYDLLLHGDKSKDISLSSGDVIFIPAAGPQVAVTGSVVNPAIYEIRDETSFNQIVALAGGLSNAAAGTQLHVERISDHQRRSMIDVDLASNNGPTVQNGDILFATSIVNHFQNAVTLRGNVANPGRYAWHEGMRISDLIPSREALVTRDYYRSVMRLADTAPEPRNQAGTSGNRPRIQNPNGAPTPNGAYTGSTTGVDSTAGATTQNNATYPNPDYTDSGNAAAGYQYNTPVRPGASTDQNSSRLPPSNTAGGNSVAEAITAGTNNFPVKTDVVLSAPDIDWNYAVISRQGKDDLTTSLLPFNLSKAVVDKDAAQDLQLMPGDVISVFSKADIRVPSNQQTRFVRLEGEFVGSGVYSVKPGETLRQLLTRAGGFTPEADLFASEFTRESVRRLQRQRLLDFADQLETQIASNNSVSTSTALTERDAAAANSATVSSRAIVARLRQAQPSGRIVLQVKPDSQGVGAVPDLELQDGDRFIVPRVPATVSVEGQVYNANAFLYEKGHRVKDYMKLAGGPDRIGDRKREFVLRADGSVVSRQYGSLAERTVFAGRNFDDVVLFPGDTIIVPPVIQKSAILRNLSDISTIIGGFGLGAAAVNVLR
ncbi:MAG TPA: SLBB domain-containing protein [Acidobacteriaceae bacterium]|nr:SLBB domain-containing protein [Acidobacteriaceae bacterium]